MGRGRDRGLKVPRLGQLGIVVSDIEDTIKRYSDAFGIGPWAVFEGEPEWCLQGGENVIPTGRIAMAQAGPVQLELIQITGGSTFYADTLGGREEGLHHVGFFVRDLAERLRAAREAGIEVLQHGMLKQLGLTIEYAYLDTTSVGGVIIEFIEPRFLGLPFPMRSPLLRLGAKLGEILPV